MATSTRKPAAGKKAASKSSARKASATKKSGPARKPLRTAAKKPYKDNTGDNTQPPKARPKDAVDLLVADHLAAGKCFKQYQTLVKKNGSAAARRELANKVCDMLKVHTRIEEEIFYPAARAAGVDAGLLDEANVEHSSAKELIAQIEAARPGDDFYDAKVKVLGDYVTHHVVEEQTEMFPKCRRSTMDLVALRRQLETMKAQLQG
ncbi:MAG TPA: hemerythrin domain-containing protein [Caldimonas sp.]|nr:hemerythrin domain-containing protein [Caldimonas sp.]